MIPDAILSALIEVKRAREATKEIRGVQDQLVEATKAANIATAAVNRFGRVRGIAVLDVDAAKARAHTAAAQKDVDGFGASTATATLAADASDAHRAVAGATGAVNGYAQTNGTATLDADGARARASVAGAAGEVKAFGGLREVATVQVDTAQARRELAGVSRDVKTTGKAMREAGDGGRSGGGGVRSFVASFGDLPGRIFLSTRLLGALLNIMLTLAPVLIGVAAQLIAVAAALAPLVGLGAGVAGAMVAAAQGFGVFKLATAGVGDALQEQIKNQSQAAATALSSSSAQRSAAKAIQSAQEGVSTAVRALSDAERDQRDAVAQLAPAYAAASRGLADMRVEAQSAVLSVARMSLGLQDAKDALSDLIRGPSPLDMADAQDAVADAARGNERAILDLTAAQGAWNDALIAGDPAGIARAQLELRDAENAVGDAQRDAARAAERLAELEKPASSRDLASARLAIAEAEQGLTDARRQAGRHQSDLNAAEAAGLAGSREVVAARAAIADAEDRLSEARRQVKQAQQGARDAQVAANDAMAAGAVAATNLNEKFDALSPAAQTFVRQLQAMKPQLDELRATAAAGFFPGASAGLKAAAGSFSSVKKVVGETATVLGEAAKKSGELVGSPAFGRDIEIIGGRNAKVIGTLGEALRHVISAFRHVLVAAGPLTQWLADVANKWALNAAEAAKAGRESGKMADFFEKTKATAQLLGSILANLASGLFGVGKASAESGRLTLESLDRLTERFADWANSVKGRNEIAAFMEKAREAMKAIAPGLASLVKAFASFSANVLPAYARILSVIGPAMDELVTIFIAWKIAVTGAAIATTAWNVAAGIATFVTGGWTTAFWALNAAMAANAIGLAVIAVAALTAAFIIAYRESETFRDIVDSTWAVLREGYDWITAHWPLLLAILTGPFGLAATVILEFGDDIVAFFKALPGRIVSALKSAPQLLIEAGGWIVNRVTEGVKAVAGFAADVGGWLKNRVVDGVHGTFEALTALGGWIVNRIFEFTQSVDPVGFLTGVGGWMRNRVEDSLRLAVEGFKSLGGWIVNRVFEFTQSVDPVGFVSSVGDWILNRVKDALEVVKDGFMGAGKSIIGWIVDGLESGANLLVKFVNKIIDVLNKIPGVEIKAVKEFAQGGVNGGAAAGGSAGASIRAFAHGGAFARTGGYVNSPITLLGEESPTHPEWVIPENPAYRSRALGLWQAAGERIGATGYAEGGVISAFRNAIDRTGANPKPSLALWEAGIVESGLRNLPYGDRDSLGALQVREGIHGRDVALDPFRSAMKFLTQGFWGKGSAISLAAGNPGATAGWVAQQTQGSGFPHRYDQVRDQALQYLGSADEGRGGGSSVLSAVTGVIGDLLSKGAGFFLDKLPGLGDIPEWLKGAGKYVLDEAGKYIKDKVSGLTGGGGSVGGAGGWPTSPRGTIIGTPYGGTHTLGNWQSDNAIDIGVPVGSKILAVRDGTITRTGGSYEGGASRFDGFQAYLNDAVFYTHLKSLAVKAGQAVEAGQVIGRSGAANGVPHLHIGYKPPSAPPGYAQGGVLGSYAQGTDYVPRTGLYGLHRGEAVVPASENRGEPTVRVIFEGLPEELQRLIRVEIEQDGRSADGIWNQAIR